MYRRGVVVILATAVPAALVAGYYAELWLALWLGDAYAAGGAAAASWLAVGVAVNCLAYLPYTLLQARGRADLTGKAHLAELPLYLAALAALVPTYGIEGAALAWAGRCVFDAVLLFALAQRGLRAAPS